MDLTNRSFLKLLDYTPEEIEGLLDLAADLKAKKKSDNTFFRRFSALSRLFPSICTFRDVASSMRFV